MAFEARNVIDVDERLRLVGTAHISTQSVELVRSQIKEWGPDPVAVELCPSRMAALTEPETLESEDLLKIINEGRSAMILLQSALAAQQRRMGIASGEKPGAELLAAIEAAEDAEIGRHRVLPDAELAADLAGKETVGSLGDQKLENLDPCPLAQSGECLNAVFHTHISRIIEL